MDPQSNVRRGRPEAARVIWSWRSGDVVAAPDPSLRRTGVVRGLIAFAVAAVFVGFAHVVLAMVVALLGAITLVAALVAPRRGYGAIHRFGERLGVWVGRALGFVLLPLIFYLVVTPLALLFRLQGRDALRQRRSDGATTYWSSRDDGSRDRDYYERQY